MGKLPEEPALRRVLTETVDYLSGLDERPVASAADVDAVAAALGGPLPEDGADALAVVEELIAGAEPGVVAMSSGRFFGWVIGGAVPAALAADWLTSTWDQNAGLLASSPAAAGAERVAAAWLLELLGLPPTAGVGFVTGAMTANFTCLAAARTAVLARVGWDVNLDGLQGAPEVRVVAGAERHESIELALRYLGLGEGRIWSVEADDEGRTRTGDLARVLAELGPGPTIVCLQAGNVHSGGFDPLAEAIDVCRAAGEMWVHIDGAFGLWAAASPAHRGLLAGHDRADSWTTDSHKTLNVPYDNGLAIVADAQTLYASMGMHAAYLIQDERPDPFASVPEFSRRARGFTVWAALRTLGRRGVEELVLRLCRHARRFADALAEIDGVEICNDVVFTQVVVSFGSDEVTRQVAARLLAEGTAWMTPSAWHGRAVLRISVSNWRTTDDDVDRTVAAVRRVLAEVRG